MNGGISPKGNAAAASLGLGAIVTIIIAVVVLTLQFVRIPSKIEDTQNADGTISHCVHYDDQRAPVVACRVSQP